MLCNILLFEILKIKDWELKPGYRTLYIRFANMFKIGQRRVQTCVFGGE